MVKIQEVTPSEASRIERGGTPSASSASSITHSVLSLATPPTPSINSGLTSLSDLQSSADSLFDSTGSDGASRIWQWMDDQEGMDQFTRTQLGQGLRKWFSQDKKGAIPGADLVKLGGMPARLNSYIDGNKNLEGGLDQLEGIVYIVVQQNDATTVQPFFKQDGIWVTHDLEPGAPLREMKPSAFLRELSNSRGLYRTEYYRVLNPGQRLVPQDEDWKRLGWGQRCKAKYFD